MGDRRLDKSMLECNGVLEGSSRGKGFVDVPDHWWTRLAAGITQVEDEREVATARHVSKRN